MSILKNLIPSRRRVRNRNDRSDRNRAAHLGVESLDSRVLLSASVVSDGWTIRINGDGGNNVVDVVGTGNDQYQVRELNSSGVFQPIGLYRGHALMFQGA